MNPKSPVVTHRSENTKETKPHNDDLSDLIFSFDNDLEAMHDGNPNLQPQSYSDNISLRSASPSSSPSKSGYVVISYPGHGVGAGRILADTHPPDAWSTLTSGDKGGGMKRTQTLSPSPLATAARQLANDDDDDDYGQRTSPYLIPPSEREPEQPPTPRTRQFRNNMLSLLSLLPAGRYSSSSPSVYEEDHQFQFDEAGADADAGACDPAAVDADYSARNHLPPPSSGTPLPLSRFWSAAD